MSNKGKRFLLLAILVTPLAWGYFNYKMKPQAVELPYYGNKTPMPDGDTIYQEIEDFSFVNQDSVVINRDSVRGKITIANFFFCSCQGTCPRMNNNLYYIAEKFKGADRVRILSHTVNPKGDSIPVLKEYSISKGYARIPNWHFLTGPKKRIYEMAEFSYLAIADGQSDEEFIHSKYITLIDANGHIRGLFDGTKGINEMNRLKDAVRVLALEMDADGKQEVK
jgi:protein SCO1/2